MKAIATAGTDLYWEIWEWLPWPGVMTMGVFLLAAVRIEQAMPRRGGRALGLGFALMGLALLYDGIENLGLLPSRYYPGYDAALTALYSETPVPRLAWWEPVLYYGRDVIYLVGIGLAALGFWFLARFLAREEPFRGAELADGSQAG